MALEGVPQPCMWNIITYEASYLFSSNQVPLTLLELRWSCLEHFTWSHPSGCLSRPGLRTVCPHGRHRSTLRHCIQMNLKVCHQVSGRFFYKKPPPPPRSQSLLDKNARRNPILGQMPTSDDAPPPGLLCWQGYWNHNLTTFVSPTGKMSVGLPQPHWSPWFIHHAYTIAVVPNHCGPC